MDKREPLIFIVSGEASGDNLAGRLMAALKRETGGRIRFAGIGGAQSEGQGLASLFPMSDLSVMGLAEVLPHLPRLIKRLNETTAAARRLKPDVVVTVDSPGFCLRLAHHLRGSGIPVIHYVAPQLWAWGPFRARKLEEAGRSHHGAVAFRGGVLRQIRHSLHLCRPSGHRCPAPNAATGRPSGRAMGLPPMHRSSACCPAAGPAKCAACFPSSATRCCCSGRNIPTFASSFRWSIRVAHVVQDITQDWPFPVRPRHRHGGTLRRLCRLPTPPWPNRAP